MKWELTIIKKGDKPIKTLEYLQKYVSKKFRKEVELPAQSNAPSHDCYYHFGHTNGIFSSTFQGITRYVEVSSPRDYIVNIIEIKSTTKLYKLILNNN